MQEELNMTMNQVIPMNRTRHSYEKVENALLAMKMVTIRFYDIRVFAENVVRLQVTVFLLGRKKSPY